MENQLDLRRYIAILQRRWLYLFLPALLIAVGSVGYAYVTPPVFEASATILIESQQIPTDLASPTVTTDAAERIRVIEQRLLTRDNLLEIARKYSLFQYLGSGVSPTQIVDSVRRSVSISQIDTVRGNSGRIVGFTVLFRYRDASTAARVTNELVTNILAQNVESRLNRASETSEFFAQQKTKIEQRLLELESQIAEYKRSNESYLPETLVLRRERLSQLQLQLGEMDQRIRIATAATEGGQPLSADFDAQQIGFRLQAKQLELESLRERLAELKPLSEKGFVPSNRVRDVERQIALADLDIQSLNTQIQNAGGTAVGANAIQWLDEQRSQIQDRADALTESIVRTPLVEVELNAMNRDYDNLQAEYRQAQAKLEDAQTGERLEQDRQSERFEVIEQASVPDTPASPNRPRIMMVGLAGGLAAGLGLLVFRQVLDRAVYSALDIERTLQLRPIGVIPLIGTKTDKRSARLRLIVLLVGVLAAIGAALYAVDTFYLPLDLLMQRLGERAQAWLAARGLIN